MLTVVLGAATGLLVAGLVMAASACKSAMPSAAQQSDEGYWTALDAKCIADNGTRASIDACRDQMRIAACGPGGTYADAGVACDDVRLSDGGKP